jgi:hypothetical protein
MPMVMTLYPVRTALTHPWVLGFSPNPAHLDPWKYMDIDLAARRKVLGNN